MIDTQVMHLCDIENMELLGSIQRKELKRVLEDQFSELRRVEFFASKTAIPEEQKLNNNRIRYPRQQGNNPEVVESKDVLVRLISYLPLRYEKDVHN